MKILTLALFAEGGSDRRFLDPLLVRLVEEYARSQRVIVGVSETIVAIGQRSREVEKVGQEICDKSAVVDLVMIHADQGGRGQQRRLASRSCAYCDAASTVCAFPRARCVIVAPQKEIEAWVLADPEAVLGALGLSRAPAGVNLPINGRFAEGVTDPKELLIDLISRARGRRRGTRPAEIFGRVAQEMNLTLLRAAESFRAFEHDFLIGVEQALCLETD